MKSGQMLQDARIKLDTTQRAIIATSTANAKVKRVTVEGARDAIKIGTGAVTTNFVAEQFRASGSLLGLFLANISGGEFRDIDLSAQDYSIYIERGAKDLRFFNAKLTAPRWNVHAYCYESLSVPSGKVLFDGFQMASADGSFLISEGFDGFTIRSGTIKQTGTAGHPIVRLYGSPRNIIIENVEAWGNAAFLDVTKSGTPQNVTLRNVTYHGPEILGPGTAAIQNLTLENVRLAP
jgi:hypothetical protein